ncbi:opioid growth factor receptor conserved region-domain-containing protein [Xylariaceae sp. FL0594]|nr:opioid growth factor receptor conserved region-domain-containing protein [Xylariaceae sp. FL0594]
MLHARQVRILFFSRTVLTRGICNIAWRIQPISLPSRLSPSNNRFSTQSPHPSTMSSSSSPKKPLSSQLDNPPPSMRRLVDFYDPGTKGADAKGRTLDTILAWPDAELERCHDYIQTVFPLPEASGVSSSAPILEAATVELFRRTPELQARVRDMFVRMLSFYGFDTEVGDDHLGVTIIIIPSKDRFKAQRGYARWVKWGDHNHLRITRIIRSLRVLGLGDAARSFYDAVRTVQTQKGGSAISRTSIEYFTRASEWDLQYTPDGSAEIPWLVGFEEKMERELKKLEEQEEGQERSED